VLLRVVGRYTVALTSLTIPSGSCGVTMSEPGG
jgi:hypothetical protein